MKNLKSILKKLTLILLASFMLASSQSLFAMDSDFESESSFSVSDEREIKFVLGQGDNVTEIPLPETFNPNISVYISALVDFSGPEVEIKIDEKSPENIRQLCNEQIIRKLIGYLELVSDGTSQLQLRSDLEDEIPEDFKALAILSDYFGVNNLCEAVASIILDKFITLENLVQFKRDPNLFHNSPDWRVESPDWQYKIISRYRSCLANKFDYKEIHEGRYERSRERKIKQSFSGMFVFVPLENNLLKILKRDNDTGQYVALKTYENIYGYDISLDGKTVLVRFREDEISFKILRWNGRRFVESGTCENIWKYNISSNGKTICVWFHDDDLSKILRWNGSLFVELPLMNVCDCGFSSDGKTVSVEFSDDSLKILRWNVDEFVEHSITYENVSLGGCKISEDGKTVSVRYDFNLDTLAYSLKILRWNEEQGRFVEHPVIYENVDGCKISKDGKTVWVWFLDYSLKIFRWNEKENKFVEHPVMYENVSLDGCKISSDGKTVSVRYDFNLDTLVYSLKILRWNEEQGMFDEHPVRYENIRGYNISEDGKTVYVEYYFNRNTRTYSLKILRWNEEESQFIESEIYENVFKHDISKDLRQLCIGFADGRFKILRESPEVKNIEQAMFVYLANAGELDLTKRDSGRQKTSELSDIFNSFDEEARNWLVEKYKIKIPTELEV